MREIVIEQRAIQLLKRLGITQVPIPVDNIAKLLNIEIGFASSEEFSGMLIRRNKSALMGINNNETYLRQRFTIAHELAHYLLEKKDTFIDDKEAIQYRNNQNNTRDKSEIVADKFAAAILMPKNIIKKDFMKLFEGKIFHEEDLEYLSEKYLVSKEAMKYRLINLRLIKS